MSATQRFTFKLLHLKLLRKDAESKLYELSPRMQVTEVQDGRLVGDRLGQAQMRAATGGVRIDDRIRGVFARDMRSLWCAYDRMRSMSSLCSAAHLEAVDFLSPAGFVKLRTSGPDSTLRVVDNWFEEI